MNLLIYNNVLYYTIKVLTLLVKGVTNFNIFAKTNYKF